MDEEAALEERVKALEDGLRWVGGDICLTRTEALLAGAKADGLRADLAGVREELEYCRSALVEVAGGLLPSQEHERERLHFIASRIDRALTYVAEPA